MPIQVKVNKLSLQEHKPITSHDLYYKAEPGLYRLYEDMYSSPVFVVLVHGTLRCVLLINHDKCLCEPMDLMSWPNCEFVPCSIGEQISITFVQK